MYKYVPPAGTQDEKADADGITESMLSFDWERDVEMPVSNIINAIDMLLVDLF